jgi:hypothetical protein
MHGLIKTLQHADLLLLYGIQATMGLGLSFFEREKTIIDSIETGVRTVEAGIDAVEAGVHLPKALRHEASEKFCIGLFFRSLVFHTSMISDNLADAAGAGELLGTGGLVVLFIQHEP